ncbi:MAG TPA: hypothetical protein P5026_02830 [Kiritimatiellia bacterium]|nr:hypothetical protein [Kiritimatiellia bacterium]HRU70427.1 hypothetical protein [Kiritimatiellia bacterium]
MKRKTAWTVVVGAVAAPLLLLALMAGLMWLRHPFPVRAGKQSAAEYEPEWWHDPPRLTDDEVAAQQWLADITYRLPAARESEYWDVGGSQHGNFSIRYQAAFSGYAAACLGMRTPAYVGVTARILSNTVARVTQKKAWRYIQSYWANEPWFPDPCARGNVMYTGHLMMLMALHEALSGQRLFNHEGVELVWDDARRFTYTTLRLAEVAAEQIRKGKGGITCEPGLIFFACNNHPHVTFRLLEGMGYGNWQAESEKWERWALRGWRATAGGGAFRLVHHEKSGLSLPRGMPGFDGWCLLWYEPWASGPMNSRHLWQLAKKSILGDELFGEPVEQPERVDFSDCCNPLKVPTAATISFLAAAARACGDEASAARLETWLDRHFRKDERGRMWLDTHREWRIGTSANRFIALAQAHGSALRPMIRRPLPREYFDGILLEKIWPDDTPVYRACRDAQGALLLEIDGRGGAPVLTLKNAGDDPVVSIAEGAGAKWNKATRTLRMEPCGRVTIRVDTSK